MSDMLEFNDKAARAMEAMYLTPDVVGQRARVIDMLCPKPGEHILDIGVGPGLLAHDLAVMVGDTGRLVGLDMAKPMLTMSRTRLAAMPWANVWKERRRSLPFPRSLLTRW